MSKLWQYYDQYGATSISCCGRLLEPLLSKAENDEHEITVHEIEEDYFVTIKHEMSRDHYISFVAYISYDRVMLIKLYPEQLAEVRFPKCTAERCIRIATDMDYGNMRKEIGIKEGHLK